MEPIEKGLNIEGHKQDVDFIAGIIRQEFTSVYHIEDIKAVMDFPIRQYTITV